MTALIEHAELLQADKSAWAWARLDIGTLKKLERAQGEWHG